MNILIISDLYPTATIRSGYFVYNQIKELSKYSNVSVVIPRELPMTYRNLSTIEGIPKEIECLSRLKREAVPNSYKPEEIRPFLKLPGKQLCFAQSKLFGMQNNEWCQRTMRSRIAPMKKVAKMLRNHRGLLLNWFRVKRSNCPGCRKGL